MNKARVAEAARGFIPNRKWPASKDAVTSRYSLPRSRCEWVMAFKPQMMPDVRERPREWTEQKSVNRKSRHGNVAAFVF